MTSNFSRPLVLLIEDSEDDAFFFRWTLDKCGLDCEIVQVLDGAGAIEYLERNLATNDRRPDLVFLDLKIPNFSGFEVLEWIHHHPSQPVLDISVLSGSEHAVDIQKSHALGASAYYVKPLSMEQLRTRFAAWRARRAAGESAHAVEIPAYAAAQHAG